MEIKPIEQSKDRLKIEIIGEDHTLSNAIRKELWLDSHVKVAGYNIEHSLVSNPVMLIETDGSENPKKSLQIAIDNLRKRNKELISDFNKALK
ncbi:DNA-directed RNA polymerase subunit L [Candidatus Woesearchaeota archaeon]|nr:DNA-directed RNA polymerase subunit L [Candidatus Woesearchaeota archaeon]